MGGLKDITFFTAIVTHLGSGVIDTLMEKIKSTSKPNEHAAAKDVKSSPSLFFTEKVLKHKSKGKSAAALPEELSDLGKIHISDAINVTVDNNEGNTPFGPISAPLIGDRTDLTAAIGIA